MSSFRYCSSNVTHPCSKAQASLNKILHIISSVPLPSSNTRGFDIDLNKCLVGPFWESRDSESLDLSACSFVGKQIQSEKTTDGSSSDITNLPETTTTEVDQESKRIIKQEDDEDGVQTGPFRGKESQNGSYNNNDCLGLLIEAAELISRTECECPSPDKELTQHLNNTESTTSASKRVTVDVEDTSPVVRSKRGRSQMLPSRYRDSVLLLEPCKRRRRPPAAPPKRSSRKRH
ncbi:hypothetical protein Patl1_30493 [Pistacia atlantica]|uniref:Uncharacterized protein n=1 Tax=Pistacia atlantica TaxID=434234 RepID=A0ACC1A959_9ROSI|nr:hypothetical protein Patl1_30493 [Pistacia atlantica]